MAMFTSEVLAKLHALAAPAARAKVEALADIHEVAVETAVKEYEGLRAKHEAAALVKALNETNAVAFPANSDQARALQGGAVGRVVMGEDGTVRVTWTLPGALGSGTGASTGRGKRGRGGRKFKYFHDGQALPRGTSVKGFLMENYPDSEAARTIREYEANEEAGVSSAKIGAWEAILKDEVVKAHFTREQVNI